VTNVELVLFNGYVVGRQSPDGLVNDRPELEHRCPLRLIRPVETPLITMPAENMVVHGALRSVFEACPGAGLTPVLYDRILGCDVATAHAAIRAMKRFTPSRFDANPREFLDALPGADVPGVSPCFEVIAPRIAQLATVANVEDRVALYVSRDPFAGLTRTMLASCLVLRVFRGVVVAAAIYERIADSIDPRYFLVEGPMTVD